MIVVVQQCCFVLFGSSPGLPTCLVVYQYSVG